MDVGTCEEECGVNEEKSGEGDVRNEVLASLIRMIYCYDAFGGCRMLGRESSHPSLCSMNHLFV